MCLWCCSSMLFNGLTFRKVDHSMSSAFLHRRNLQNSFTMVVPHFDSKKLCSLETGATPAKSERSSRFRSLDGCILKAGFFGVIPQREKPAKASHAKDDVCVFLARDQQIVGGPSKVPLCVFFRSLWLEVWPKVWGIFQATQSPLTYSSWRCKDPMDFSIFPRWHVKCRTLFAWCLHFHKKTPVRPSLPREFQADSPPGLHCMSPTFGTPERWKGQKPCNGSMHSFRVWLIFLFPPFQMKCGCVFP